MNYLYTQNWRFLVKAENGKAHYCRTAWEAVTCQRLIMDKYGMQSCCYRRREIEKPEKA